LLLQRPLSSRFAAGAHVFPGGTIDAEDEAAETLALLKDHGADEPQALLAALREAFEETGLLLTAPGSLDAKLRDRLLADRARLLEGEMSFGSLLRRHGMALDGSAAEYFARWITPVQLSRRYDTRFFLARHPGGEPVLTREHTAFVWLDPSEALERFSAGSLPMLFPTRKTLELLSRFERLDDALASFREREVRPILAELIVVDGQIRPVPVDGD
jgi:8-oxo-dGTP pyrophosphatase MutT (NUDIX family)